MVLTTRHRASALVLGVALVLSACTSADPEPNSGSETVGASTEPSATSEPVAADKRVVEGYTTGDTRLKPPAGTYWLSGEEEMRWAEEKQLGLLLFYDHYSESEIFPSVELRYKPRRITVDEVVDEELQTLFPGGELGEPVELEGETFERYVTFGQLRVGTDYEETPMEVFFTRRNEGTYYLYAVGIPGETAVSDEVRQTAFDALVLDSETIDASFPPGQDEGSVTFELESFSEFTVGEDIPPGRYEVYGEIPEGVFAGSLIAHQDGGSVYEAYRALEINGEEAHRGSAWLGFLELYEGDTLSYTMGYHEEEAPPSLGTVTFKPLPESTAFRTVLPGNGDWVSGVDFKPGVYQLRSFYDTLSVVSIFDPDGRVLFDGRITVLDRFEQEELYNMEPDEYITRENLIGTFPGMPSVSNAFDLPAGSRILIRTPGLARSSNTVELIPAPHVTDRPETAFVTDPGAIHETPSSGPYVTGDHMDPGVYKVIAEADNLALFDVYLLGAGRVYSGSLNEGEASHPIYIPTGSVVYVTTGVENEPFAYLEPAEPVPFGGGELGGRILRVGTDIEPGTWKVTGTGGVLDTYDANGELINQVAVVRDHEKTVELEDGQIIVDSDYYEFSGLSLDR